MDPNGPEESSEMNNIFENDADKSTYTCDICKKNFKCRRSIKNHVRLKGHNGLPVNAKTSLPVRIPQEWNWKLATNKADLVTILGHVKDIKEIKEWMSQFMLENHCRFILRNTVYSSDVKRLLYYCEHYQKPSRPTTRKRKIKGTDCPCKISIRLERNVAEVQLKKLVHNHSLTSTAVVSFFRPSEEIKGVFKKMFENGAGPAEALRNFKNHLEMNCQSDEEFLINCADRSKTPDYDWVRYFYHQTFVKKYGSTKGNQLVINLQNFIENTNKEASETICLFEQIDADNFVVVIVTSLMRRVLDTSTAGEIMFMDSCGSVDKFGLRLFLLMTKLSAGGVPVGVLITTSETTPVLTKALSLFSSLISSTSFGGRGSRGPMNILTDDSSSEIAALQSVFPESRHFLCIFHVLQSVYRWLNDTNHKVNSRDRDIIYNHIKKMLYSQNEEELNEIYSKLLSETENQAVRKYVTTLYQRKEKWALCFRQDTLLRGSNTNNIAERGMRVLKENILNRIKAQTPTQLVDFIVKDYTEFYKQKLLDATVSRPNTSDRKSMADYVVTKSSTCDTIFIVSNATKKVAYTVNTDIGICSCFIGVTGNYCKHQQLLEVDHPLSCISVSAKSQLYFLATGSTTIPNDFFELLNHASNSQAIVQVRHDLTNNDHAIIEESVSHPHDNQAEEDALALIQKYVELHTNLGDFMKKNPAEYLGGLRSYVKELEGIVRMPSKVITSLYSFNKNVYS